MNKKVGVVLSSGGGRGIFAHTGFLLALKELGFSIQALAGCSAGAIVGAVVASGGDIQKWADDLKMVKIHEYWTPKSRMFLMYNLIVRKGKGLLGLSDTKAAMEYVSRYLGSDQFEDCLYPFYVVALNVGNNDKIIFKSKSLVEKVMASAAMPVFYEPVEIDNEYYSDGATVDLAPADAICCRHQLDVVIIHHVANRNYTVEQLRKSIAKPWSIGAIVYRLIYRQKPWYEIGQDLSYHKCPCGCKAMIVVVELKLPDLTWTVTKGGIKILESAQAQALTVLGKVLEQSDRQY